MYTIATATAAVGRNKSAILPAINAGKISAVKDENGEWQIDPAELEQNPIGLNRKQLVGILKTLRIGESPRTDSREARMPKPYSQDLRERVVRAVEAGASCHEAAAAFEVSPSSAIRWVARWRQTGSAAAKPMGGKRSPLDAHKPWLLELIAAEADLTLREIRSRLRQRGVTASASSVWRFCDRHDITFKKSLHAAEQDREDVRTARANWKQEQPRLDPSRFVFIDETGTSTNMTKLRGRCLRGKRLIAKVSHGHWKMTTFVAGLRQDGMTAPFVVDAPMSARHLHL